MAPCQEPVEVPDFRVKLVVPLRSDRDDAVRANLSHVGCHLENSIVRDTLAVAYLHECQLPLAPALHISRGDDQGAEVVTFARFVDSDSLAGGLGSVWCQ